MPSIIKTTSFEFLKRKRLKNYKRNAEKLRNFKELS